jgi:hypothetical protein
MWSAALRVPSLRGWPDGLLWKRKAELKHCIGPGAARSAASDTSATKMLARGSRGKGTRSAPDHNLPSRTCQPARGAI